MDQPIISFEHVTFQYEGADVPVLNDVSFSVEAGEVVLLLGPSGSGKSTLLLCLNGIIPKRIAGQFRGQVRVAGLAVEEHEVYELAQKVGLVFQDPEAQFSMLYVEDEVAFGLENLCYPREVIRERVMWALHQVGMADKFGARLDRLSGGEKQKVALASVLAMEPDILALDAPTANLDPASAHEFWELLRRLHEGSGHTLIIVEQHIDEIIDMVDRVILLDGEGQVIGNGPPREVIESLGMAALERCEVWIPQIWELTDMARRRGAIIPAYPFTMEEASAVLGAWIRQDGFAPPEEDGGETNVLADVNRPILAVERLSHTYTPAFDTRPALQEVSLQIAAGDFCAIVGQNGAGKTTLAKYLTGILEPPPETVYLDGVDVATLPLAELTRRVGYVFQNPEHQFVEDTVYDELAYGLRVRGVDEATVRARVREVLTRFRLRAKAHRHPFSLSQGEKRLLSVAAMLILDPAVLILDEPTLGLDRGTALALMTELQERNTQGTTILFITHDMHLVTEYARSVAVMSEGTVVFQGPVEALFQQPEVLATAALREPPVVALARQLRVTCPTLPTIRSVRDFRRLWEAA